MLHHYLSSADVKPSLSLHTDSCTGQNKNKSVLAYLMWRCLTGLSNDIELSFMRVSHTRCAVDSYFGLLKQKWRAKENGTLGNVEEAVNSSCSANQAVMCSRDWLKRDSFQSQWLRPICGITKFQHFKISTANATHIECQAAPTSPAVMIKIVKDDVEPPTLPTALPTVLLPTGLSDTRRQYLEKEVHVALYFSATAAGNLPRSS